MKASWWIGSTRPARRSRRAARSARCTTLVRTPTTRMRLRDAIEAATLPVIELHISNVHAREEFRHHSVISPLARGIIVGFGVQGYSMAINGLYELSQRAG